MADDTPPTLSEAERALREQCARADERDLYDLEDVIDRLMVAVRSALATAEKRRMEAEAATWEEAAEEWEEAATDYDADDEGEWDVRSATVRSHLRRMGYQCIDRAARLRRDAAAPQTSQGSTGAARNAPAKTGGCKGPELEPEGAGAGLRFCDGAEECQRANPGDAAAPQAECEGCGEAFTGDIAVRGGAGTLWHPQCWDECRGDIPGTRDAAAPGEPACQLDTCPCPTWCREHAKCWGTTTILRGASPPAEPSGAPGEPQEDKGCPTCMGLQQVPPNAPGEGWRWCPACTPTAPSRAPGEPVGAGGPAIESAWWCPSCGALEDCDVTYTERCAGCDAPTIAGAVLGDIVAPLRRFLTEVRAELDEEKARWLAAFEAQRCRANAMAVEAERVAGERDEALRQLAAVTQQACGESCASEITALRDERDEARQQLAAVTAQLTHVQVERDSARHERNRMAEERDRANERLQAARDDIDDASTDVKRHRELLGRAVVFVSEYLRACEVNPGLGSGIDPLRQLLEDVGGLDRRPS